MKTFLKESLLFLLGGSIYYLIEIFYRGFSHISMFVLGGFSFAAIGLLNEILPWEMLIEIQALCGGILITILEFITGLIVNIWLKLNIWNYALLPLNIMGQICLPFTLIWIALSFVAILLDDWIRYKFFNEEKPHYTTVWGRFIRKRK